MSIPVQSCLNIRVPHDALQGLDVKERRGYRGERVPENVCSRTMQVNGQIRETEEPFEMDGKKAMYPGDFGKAEEDCNCRCVALTRAKWALDEEELKTLKERAKFFGLDKKDDFKAFEEKYLKVTETLKNQGKSGTIERENFPFRWENSRSMH